MPFTPQEQSIIQWGQTNGKSKEDVTKAISNFRAGIQVSKVQPTEVTTPETSPSYGERVTSAVSSDINKRVERVGNIMNRSQNPIEKSVQILGQGAGMAAHTFESTVGEIPGIKQVVGAYGAGINWLATSKNSPLKSIGEKIGESKALQELVELYDTDPDVKDTIDGVSNMVRLYGDAEIVRSAANLAKSAINKIKHKMSPSSDITPDEWSQRLAEKNREYAMQIDNSKALQTGDKVLNQSQLRDLSNPSIKDVKAPSMESIIETQNWKPGTKAIFDNALLTKNATIVQEMLPSVPKEYQSLFSKEISHVLETNFVGESVGMIPKTKNAIVGGVDVMKNAVKDIIPTSERVISHEVAHALDLNASDVRKINLSTGNEPGKFLADNNLIGNNKDITTQNLSDFFGENYRKVRSEIGNVKSKYPANTIPRYREALTSIKEQIRDVPGLQEANSEVDALIKNKLPSLSDVQRVKELVDDHFNLYNALGDVKEGVAKQGLEQIRNDLQQFIEQQVTLKTGADIGRLNNNVATSKSLLNAIEQRSTKGLTSSNIKMGDLGIFGIGSFMGTPLFGAALLFGKKLLESSAIRLRIAKGLDKFSDARKLKFQEQLKQGEVPPEMNNILKESDQESDSNNLSSPSNQSNSMMNGSTNNLNNNSFIDTSIAQPQDLSSVSQTNNSFKTIPLTASIGSIFTPKSGETFDKSSIPKKMNVFDMTGKLIKKGVTTLLGLQKAYASTLTNAQMENMKYSLAPVPSWQYQQNTSPQTNTLPQNTTTPTKSKGAYVNTLTPEQIEGFGGSLAPVPPDWTNYSAWITGATDKEGKILYKKVVVTDLRDVGGETATNSWQGSFNIVSGQSMGNRGVYVFDYPIASSTLETMPLNLKINGLHTYLEKYMNKFNNPLWDRIVNEEKDSKNTSWAIGTFVGDNPFSRSGQALNIGTRGGFGF